MKSWHSSAMHLVTWLFH